VSVGRLRRLAEQGRPTVRIEVDGEIVTALEGDSILVAALASGRTLRRAEFGGGDRAGFCLMGACQDCWIWTADVGRLRGQAPVKPLSMATAAEADQ
jgi:hypothetical protein